MKAFRRLFSARTTTGKLLLSAVLLALSCLGLFWPLAQQSASARSGATEAPVDWQSEIKDYSATYRVGADGHVAATEVLTVRLGANRHGIFRFFPVADPTDPHARMVPSISGITMDDRAVPVSYEWRDSRRVYVARIGDPNATVSPGLHTYAISYTVDGGLVRPPTAPGHFTNRAGANSTTPTASFYYNVVGFWMMRVDAAHVSIDLPGPSGLTQCAADDTGATPCAITGAGTDHVTVTTAGLPPQNPVTVRIDLPVPLPHRATLPWTVRFDKTFGRSLPAAGLMAALSLLAALGGYLWDRRSREASPGTPVLYVPPDGLGPVQTAYIVTENVGDHALVATLLYMAERRLVRLDRTGSARWRVTGLATPEQWAAADPVTREVGDALGVTTADAKFSLTGSQTAGSKLSKATDRLVSSCRSWARTEGFVVTVGAEWAGRLLVIVCMVLAVVGFWGAFTWTMWGLPFAAFAIGGIGLLASGVGTRRTPSGRRMWSRAAGFRRLLATPSAEDRFDYSAHRDLFVSYIPYAVAFGVAEAWAAKYRAATGSEPPIPDWYPASRDTSPAALYSSAGGFASFDSAVSASISAYNASQSSSSSSGGSSFSSSGGSWGGGGGGGGGTW
ncbi:DUF2207 domain-containing protein [Mycobacterium sp. SMC-2]|uniref:DUF2207 domain-containing protein n=1 Tax=Mycobacterium sp. SMC-2 TaxID=2857058 RepID=UPI0021B2CC03|nr:DUF2207 domain-containing protein [Mycobacterium sp. SMC-2]UXA07644.1 DUF2207 domain-containing protein [Mycobacterium sp. SMC-2]